MTATAVRYLTLGEIAARLGVPVHRVVYALRARGVPAAAQVGKNLGYDEAAVEAVRAELARIGAKR